MSYYTKHLFVCVNQRDNGEQCCNDVDAEASCSYAKSRVKALGLAGKNGIRVNKAGCLGRCAEGPVLVVYPEGVWYRYQTQQDIDEIISQHLQQNRIVERLLLAKENPT
jgi:(2Fe-2S) ferredoxin